MALPNNVLKVNNIAGIDGTLRKVADSLGTESPLSVSTGEIGLSRARVTGDGALNVQRSDGAFGAGYYAALVLGDVENGESIGAAILSARQDPLNQPFFCFTGYDGGAADKTLYFGGGGFGVPDANRIGFYTSESDLPDTGYNRLNVEGDGKFTFQCESDADGFLFGTRGGAESSHLQIRADGTIRPVSLADGSAANNSIYYSTTANKLVYKDSGGVVNNLY